MKNQIDIFKICEQCNIIASRYFTIHGISLNFKILPSGSKAIEIFINIIDSDGKLNGFIASIEQCELKFGSDLIYNRVEKAAIAKAISLDCYSPQLLVF
jgi:hypothetical protein